jgi:hypothetical protein
MFASADRQVKNMQLRLITLADERHYLQDQIFYLEDRFCKATRQIELYKSETTLFDCDIERLMDSTDEST